MLLSNKMTHRSAYDRNMIDYYHTPPWDATLTQEQAEMLPIRTNQDIKLQHTWCPSCHMDYNIKKKHVEGYAPVYGFRTHADMALQDTWCPKCNCSTPGQCICQRPPSHS